MTQKEIFIIKMMTPFISQESSWRVFKRVSIFVRDQAENWEKFQEKIFIEGIAEELNYKIIRAAKVRSDPSCPGNRKKGKNSDCSQTDKNKMTQNTSIG